MNMLMVALAFLFVAPHWVASQDSNRQMLVQGNTAFALDLYSKLRQEKGNIFFSPYSLSTALAMAYSGAKGKTAEEMTHVLRFTLEPKQLHSAFKTLAEEIHRPGKPYQLHTANALWGQKGFSFIKEFLSLVQENYDAGLKELDFINAAEEARTIINTWVEEQTEKKIKELLQKGVLQKNTRLILTNALYFKGNWLSQFKKEQTQEQHFWITKDEKLLIPLMQQTQSFKYYEQGLFQMLELPYAGKDLSMVVILPKRNNDLPEIEKSLSRKNLESWLTKLQETKVKVYFPKFKVTAQFSLNNALSTMGMPTAFHPKKADFSAMTGGKELFISAVIHKACVDIDEEGTEAAAATAVGFGITSLPPPPPVFRADRPFLYFIRDTGSGSILFMGRLVNPKA